MRNQVHVNNDQQLGDSYNLVETPLSHDQLGYVGMAQNADQMMFSIRRQIGTIF